MQDSEKDILIQQLLEQRDRMYREMRLKEERISELEILNQTISQQEKALAQKDKDIAQRDKDIAQKDKDIAQKDKDIAQKEKIITKKEHAIQNLENRVTKLEGQLAWLQRKMWGKMSEKFIPFDPNQRLIEWEGLDLLPEEEEAAKSSDKDIEILRIQQEKRRQEIQLKKQPKRQPLPSDLPHEYIDLYPEGYEGHEEEWTLFEETEDSEHLEYTPGSFKVIVSRRHKGIRKADRQIEIAPIPSMPIAKSYATPSLLAELHLGKYADHLPFYRQIEQFKRLGVTLAASTINDWFFESADLMRPLYYRIKELVMSSDYVQCDETTIPIVNEEKQKTVKGYLWDVRAVMSGLLFFHYDHGSRAQKVALALFHNYKGALQTDGYAAYEAFENKNGVLLLGCWVHARRYFERALQNDKERAEYALAQIAKIYTVETEADDQNMTFEQRAELRKRVIYPILCAFERWMYNEAPKVLPKSPIGKAISYTYGIFYRLTRYHLDGRYLPDNNLIENSIRPIAIGRKNYLFCGNDEAAENAAIVYTMMGCCKVAQVDFRQWLLYFFCHIHEYDNDYSRSLDDFLPATLKQKGLL